MKSFQLFIAAGLFSLLEGTCVAAPAEFFPYDFVRTYASLGQASLNETQAQQQRVGRDVTSLRFGSERMQSRYLYAGGLSVTLYNDNAAFSQSVNADRGVNQTAHSTAGGVNLYMEAGYHLPLSQKWSIDLLAGYEHVLLSRRGIINCKNCYAQEIDISTGLYLQPRIVFTPNRNWFFGVSANHYWDVDVEQSWMLTVGRMY